MPKTFTRIWLEVVGVRVERLQEISASDAVAEGIAPCVLHRGDTGEPVLAIPRFRRIWDKINSKRGYSWDSNPFVWVVEFRRSVK